MRVDDRYVSLNQTGKMLSDPKGLSYLKDFNRRISRVDRSLVADQSVEDQSQNKST